MRRKMSGRLGNQKRRKGKCSSEAQGSNKVSAGRRRRDTKRPTSGTSDATATTPQSRSPLYGYRGPAERLSHISCECHQLPDRTRCAASPVGPEGKENKLKTRPESGCCLVKREGEGTGDRSADIYPDEDSNQILPVEFFFGNMDVVQDCPRRPASTSTWGRREHRRRHYYAKDNSDDEEEEEDGMTAEGVGVY